MLDANAHCEPLRFGDAHITDDNGALAARLGGWAGWMDASKSV